MRAIVLVDENFGIGCQGEQILYLKSDLQRFVRLTRGHVMIYGRKTMETFPDGLPLKGRLNLILSERRDISWPEDREAKVIHSLEELQAELRTLKAQGYLESEFFVLGGASVYEQLLPSCDSIELTYVRIRTHADRSFPREELLRDFELSQESEEMTEVMDDGRQISYVYRSYRRKS